MALVVIAGFERDLTDRTLGQDQHLPRLFDPQRMQKAGRRHPEEMDKLPVEMGRGKPREFRHLRHRDGRRAAKGRRKFRDGP